MENNWCFLKGGKNHEFLLGAAPWGSTIKRDLRGDDWQKTCPFRQDRRNRNRSFEKKKGEAPGKIGKKESKFKRASMR